MAINFNDTTQPASFELCTEEKKYNVSITAPVGELLQPHTMNEKDFIKEQGRSEYLGDNMSQAEVSRPPDMSVYWKTIFFISHPKHMLKVLKQTVSMRWFF